MAPRAKSYPTRSKKSNKENVPVLPARSVVRSSKRLRNPTIMPDSIPAFFIPSGHISKRNHNRDGIGSSGLALDDNILVDTTNLRSSPELSIFRGDCLPASSDLPHAEFSIVETAGDTINKSPVIEAVVDTDTIDYGLIMSTPGTCGLEMDQEISRPSAIDEAISDTLKAIDEPFRSNPAVRLIPNVVTSEPACNALDAVEPTEVLATNSEVLVSATEILTTVSNRVQDVVALQDVVIATSQNVFARQVVALQDVVLPSAVEASVNLEGDHQDLTCTPAVIIAPAIASGNNHLAQQGFLPISESDWKATTEDCGQNSLKNNNWARNKFDSWRVFMGFGTRQKIEELDLKDFGVLLSRFFLMCCKSTGERYPSGSLMNMFMSFQRIIIKEQERRVIRTGIQEPKFGIRQHPFFIGSCRALHKAMVNSRNAGANKNTRKVAALTWKQERDILDHELHQVNTPKGCQMRFALYCFIIFLIRGCKELWALRRTDFIVERDEENQLCLRYDERLSKTYGINLKNRFQDDHFRSAVISRDPDVVRTFQVLMHHMPEESKESHLFLSPIKDSRSVVWYKGDINVGEGTLRTWMRTMAKNAGIEGDITNKSGRVTSITRMLAARVPPEVVAKITGHRNLKTLGKYDRILMLKARAAHELLRNPYSNGQLNDFDAVYAKQLMEYNKNQLGVEISTQEEAEADDFEQEDPNDFNGFIEDVVGPDGDAVEGVGLGTNVNDSENCTQTLRRVQANSNNMQHVQHQGRGFPSVPDPPAVGRGSVIHWRRQVANLVPQAQVNVIACNPLEKRPILSREPSRATNHGSQPCPQSHNMANKPVEITPERNVIGTIQNAFAHGSPSPTAVQNESRTPDNHVNRIEPQSSNKSYGAGVATLNPIKNPVQCSTRQPTNQNMHRSSIYLQVASEAAHSISSDSQSGSIREDPEFLKRLSAEFDWSSMELMDPPKFYSKRDDFNITEYERPPELMDRFPNDIIRSSALTTQPIVIQPEHVPPVVKTVPQRMISNHRRNEMNQILSRSGEDEVEKPNAHNVSTRSISTITSSQVGVPTSSGFDGALPLTIQSAQSRELVNGNLQVDTQRQNLPVPLQVDPSQSAIGDSSKGSGMQSLVGPVSDTHGTVNISVNYYSCPSPVGSSNPGFPSPISSFPSLNPGYPPSFPSINPGYPPSFPSINPGYPPSFPSTNPGYSFYPSAGYSGASNYPFYSPGINYGSPNYGFPSVSAEQNPNITHLSPSFPNFGATQSSFPPPNNIPSSRFPQAFR